MKYIRIGDIKRFRQYFENSKIDVNRKSTYFQETVLFVACQNGRFDIVEHMLGSKRELNLTGENYQGISPLQIAKINSELHEKKLSHTKELKRRNISTTRNNCLLIYNLLQEYQSDSKGVKKRLRKKLNLEGKKKNLFLSSFFF